MDEEVYAAAASASCAASCGCVIARQPSACSSQSGDPTRSPNTTHRYIATCGSARPATTCIVLRASARAGSTASNPSCGHSNHAQAQHRQNSAIWFHHVSPKKLIGDADFAPASEQRWQLPSMVAPRRAVATPRFGDDRAARSASAPAPADRVARSSAPAPPASSCRPPRPDRHERRWLVPQTVHRRVPTTRR